MLRILKQDKDGNLSATTPKEQEKLLKEDLTQNVGVPLSELENLRKKAEAMRGKDYPGLRPPGGNPKPENVKEEKKSGTKTK